MTSFALWAAADREMIRLRSESYGGPVPPLQASAASLLRQGYGGQVLLCRGNRTGRQITFPLALTTPSDSHRDRETRGPFGGSRGLPDRSRRQGLPDQHRAS
jgi:hypothetical protein